MSDSDLNWLALRYVTGEMADGELAAFEETLADSQPAREAVAAAVLLAQAVALAERKLAVGPPELVAAPATRHGTTWRARLAWALAGAAASLLLAGGLQLWREARQAPNPIGGHQAVSAGDLSSLALQWTAAGDFEFDVADSSERRDSDDLSAEGRGAFAIADLFEDLAAPDWLLAAVSSESRSPMAAPMQNPDG